MVIYTAVLSVFSLVTKSRHAKTYADVCAMILGIPSLFLRLSFYSYFWVLDFISSFFTHNLSNGRLTSELYTSLIGFVH